MRSGTSLTLESNFYVQVIARARFDAPPTPLLFLPPAPTPSFAMPKEATESLFCCGKLHKSGKYHKRTVHQQYTKISFPHHPDASFVLRRNPATKLFHCPQCDKSWAMATPVRNHIFQKCEGYAEYRSSPKIKIKPIGAAARPPGEYIELNAFPKEEQEDSTKFVQEADLEQKPASFGSNSLIQPQWYTTSGLPHYTKPPTPPASSASPTSSAASSEPSLLLPALRPAIWSPVNTVGKPSGSQLLSVVPSLSGSVSSRSSTFSLQTVSDDFGAPRFALKTEYDYYDIGSISGASSSPFVPRAEGTATAAYNFLNGLRRPLGYVAPHLHALGLITEADLDLACAMPDAWDELGDILRGSGVTVLEWLMVKEALKTRANQAVART